MNKSFILLAAPIAVLLAGCDSAGGADGSTVDVTNIDITLKGDDARMPLDLAVIPGGELELSRDVPVNKAGGRRLSAVLNVEGKTRDEVVEFYTAALKEKSIEPKVNKREKSTYATADTEDGSFSLNASDRKDGKTYVSISSNYPDQKFLAPKLKAAAE